MKTNKLQKELSKLYNYYTITIKLYNYYTINMQLQYSYSHIMLNAFWY